MDINPIRTDKEKCVGCHKCIFSCPTDANIENINFEGSVIALKSTIRIDDKRCIQCGDCIEICHHDARYYVDETDQFFNDLKSKKYKMAVITAPAFLYNFKDYKRIVGWLKHLGVEIIQDVSLGADITTYLYLKMLNSPVKTYISQPCPVVVNYIEMNAPHLIPSLAPVQSPIMCLAIWMKKYENFRGKIALISPCIAKEVEINDKNNNEYIGYNITVAKLKDYITKNNINLEQFPEAEFDNTKPNLGYNYSRPGGLREQVEYYSSGEVWVKQIEGVENFTKYFAEYNERIKDKKLVPHLIDVLNCARGCNHGTGTNHDISTDEIDFTVNMRKKVFIKQNENHKPCDNPLHKMFSEKLNLEDFVRKYTPRPIREIDRTTPEYQAKIEEIFVQLGKLTEEQKNHDCNACCRKSCHRFAEAVVDGVAMVSSCFFYSQKLLKDMMSYHY